MTVLLVRERSGRKETASEDQSVRVWDLRNILNSSPPNKRKNKVKKNSKNTKSEEGSSSNSDQEALDTITENENSSLSEKSDA